MPYLYRNTSLVIPSFSIHLARLVSVLRSTRLALATIQGV